MYDRPTLSQLMDRVRGDVLTRMAADDLLRRSDAEIQARVQALAMHAMYGFVAWVRDQMFTDTCDDDELPRKASFWKVPRKAEQRASGEVAVNAAAGALIPAGSAWRALDGWEYVARDDVLADIGGQVTVTVDAAVAGAGGNRTAGQQLLLMQPIDGVQTVATVVALGGGADLEAAADWRARILFAQRNPPAGGNKADYERWALEVPGVTRAWAYPLEMGLGTIVVRFVRDNDTSLIPDANAVAAVQAHIETKKPDPAVLAVVAPIAVPVDYTIRAEPNTAVVRAAITAELDDLHRREAVPGGKLLLSHIRESVSRAEGETDSTVSVPATDLQAATGEIFTRGTITWL